MRTTRNATPRATAAALLLATAAIVGAAAAATGPAAEGDRSGGERFSAPERAIREGVTHPWIVYRHDGAYLVDGAGGDATRLVRFENGAGG